jgi:GntR family transcriptional regulator
MATDLAPKYEQTYREILARLKAGRYPVGSRIPTENEFAEFFDISRVTIRRALDMLVDDGYIQRRQGSGYRVLTLSPASDTCLTSFTDAMLRQGLEPRSRFLSLHNYQANDDQTRHLPENLRAQPVTCIRRLRQVNDTPRMLVITYAPEQFLVGASARDFPETGPEQSILRILRARFNLEWSTACEDISPVLCTEEMAKLFSIPRDQPLLRQACSAFDEDGNVVFHEDVFRHGSVCFNLTPNSRSPRHL